MGKEENHKWLQIMSRLGRICAEWPTLQEIAKGGDVSVDGLSDVKAMQPWELLDEQHLAQVQEFKNYVHDKVISKVTESFLQHSSEPLQKIHKNFLAIVTMLADKHTVVERLDHINAMELDVACDPGQQLIKYASSQSAASLFTGLSKLVQAIQCVKSLGDLCRKEGVIDIGVCKTISATCASLAQYHATCGDLSGLEALVVNELHFGGFGKAIKDALTFLDELLQTQKDVADKKASTIIKGMYACTPDKDQVADPKILTDKPMQARLLDETKRTLVPGAVREAKELIDRHHLLKTATGSFELLDGKREGRLEQLKEAKLHGRISVGLSFLVDHLTNHRPTDDASVPSFAKELQNELVAKKIRMPPLAITLLRSMQGGRQ